MGITERETNLIIDRIESLRNDLLDFKKEDFGSFRGEMKDRLESLGELIQVHNGRIDDLELKHIECSTKVSGWYVENDNFHKSIEKKDDKKSKSYSWIIPMIAASLIGIGTIILSIVLILK